MSSASWQGRRTILGGAITADWRGMWHSVLIGVLTLGLLAFALGLVMVRREEQHLRSRLGDQARSIRFVHDLVVLCSYDRHFCVSGETGPSPLVAQILRKSGANPRNPGSENDR